MAFGLLARKIGMSRVFLPTGEAVPVTYLQIDDNEVIRTKTAEKDGYQAVVLGIGQKKIKTRKGNEITRYRKEKEFTVDSLTEYEKGKKLTVAALPVESLVTITGISKGKGFQGVMKRWNFGGGPASHGHHFKREPGSVGMRTWPGRIHAGKKMPGHMGLDTVTVKHRKVLVCDEGRKVIGVKGPVPGPNGTIVTLTLEPAATKKTPSKK